MSDDVFDDVTFAERHAILEDLQQLPACCQLAFAIRWVRSLWTILANLGKGLPKELQEPNNRLVNLAQRLVCNPHSSPEGLDKAAKVAALAHAHYRQAWDHLADLGEHVPIEPDDDPVCLLLDGTWSMFGAVDEIGQASLAFRDRQFDKLAEHTHECILGTLHSLGSLGEFLQLTGGGQVDRSMLNELFWDDFDQLEAQALENGWQDDTPLPAAVFIPSYIERGEATT